MNEPTQILIVDDTEENLIALEALLAREGLEILRASSGAEALELLLRHDVALALLDVQMPEMDGFELAELMRGAERTKHIPIIFITAANRDPQRIFKGYESGAVDFLFKPVDPYILKSKVEVFFELDRQRRELARLLRLNEMFVAVLGHDLRNPLSTLSSGMQLLEAQLEDEKAQRMLHRMRSAGDRMTAMIDQLLDLTRARLGGGIGLGDTRSRVEIDRLVARVAEELRVAHPARELRVECRGDCVGVGDPDRLLQLLSNLLANALQHSEASSPIRVAVEGQAQEIRVWIHNAGVIAAEQVPSLFDPFRGRKERAASQGLGLGLFISQQIAQAHGGFIEVESKDSKGTTFCVRLPRRAPS